MTRRWLKLFCSCCVKSASSSFGTSAVQLADRLVSPALPVGYKNDSKTPRTWRTAFVVDWLAHADIIGLDARGIGAVL